MKYIDPMYIETFANKLLDMKTDDVIEFGLDGGYNWPEEVPSPNEVKYWYFAKKIYIPGYESRFILIDHCGGEEAFAIPLNCNSDIPDGDDKDIVFDYVKRFFDDHDLRNNDYVFVEINE